ncbi:nucleotide-diphospho-sugar transferase [Neocallimastix californiae]|uniref:Nucleotide-diphospho-sugar transferase n=1 Tax=Neocallimastix californiae TaxID=1754190 RepID=A0A1Y2ADP5_9FUNG|nr:nucleotide-diphospho-sugar transferase [Neocallimastix californiae]|eukprot:ORY20626.1 nucleotide-diphospho-sugar transferase [Neocallimastix californiae]
MKLFNRLILIIFLFLDIFLKSTLGLSLSIIVPVYNSGPFLDRCIKSILNQTFKDYELILVDDASSDNSLDILKKYKETDNRIKIIHLEINKGPGGARNIGMDYAEGEFIGFVDSDDYIDESFFEILMKNSYDNDIIVGHMVKGTNISDNYIKEKPSTWAVYDKIWRKPFLKNNNIRFNELMRHGGEDIEFNDLAYKFNPKILKLPDEGIYYYYKRRTGSNTNYSKKRLRKFERMAKKENLINKKNKKNRKN